MPRIGNSEVPLSEIPCNRCGSKRKIAKKWTEKIKNDHSVAILEHIQIVCTNKECQSKFEGLIMEDSKKREKLMQIRTDNIARKEAEKIRTKDRLKASLKTKN